MIERNERNPDKDKMHENPDQNGYQGNNPAMFAGGFGGGFMDYSAQAPPPQQNGAMDGGQAKNGGVTMDSDLKSMLYQFLANQKL